MSQARHDIRWVVEIWIYVYRNQSKFGKEWMSQLLKARWNGLEMWGVYSVELVVDEEMRTEDLCHLLNVSKTSVMLVRCRIIGRFISRTHALSENTEVHYIV